MRTVQPVRGTGTGCGRADAAPRRQFLV